MKIHTRRQPTSFGDVVRRALVTATAGVAISGAAFATVAVLVDHYQLEMSYGPPTSNDIDSTTR